MKKSLLAVAVLGAFAANAMAADVTLYGKVDTGFKYVNSKVKGQKATNKFSMESGMAAGSRFGLKGKEDLGNGWSVGFLLEAGISSDNGTLGQNGRIFGRETTVNLAGPYGTFYFGRMGGVGGGSASSPVSLWGMGSAFGTSWSNNALTQTLQSNAERMDNSIAYVSPSFAGFQAIAFYSMSGNDVKVETDDVITLAAGTKENSEKTNRYYGLGVKYINGPIAAFGVVDQHNYENRFNRPDNKDSLAVTLGGSYDFGFMKLYATGQYFDNLKVKQTVSAPKFNVTKKVDPVYDEDRNKYENGGQQKGYAVSVSANVPLAGGNFKAQLGYVDAEDVKDSQYEGNRYVGGIGYQYPLSKRTFVYTGASYLYDKVEAASSTKKTKTAEFFFGLNHSF